MKALCPAHQEALSLSPMIPATISPTQNRREAAAGSPNTRMPKRTVPTAYSRPDGICRPQGQMPERDPQKNHAEDHGGGSSHAGPQARKTFRVFQPHSPAHFTQAGQ